MTNRRQFLQSGVAVSALPLALDKLTGRPSGTGGPASDFVRLHKAIYDDRYVEGQRFADAMRGFGVPCRALENGDVTAFWYEELDLLWRERQVAVAGWTQFGPMFVLERLAAERGLRMALRIEHGAREHGSLSHVVAGSPETLALARPLASKLVDWPVLAAALATHCSADCAALATQTMVTAGTRPVLSSTRAQTAPGSPETVIHYYMSRSIQNGESVPWDGPLFSWVIAPAA